MPDGRIWLFGLVIAIIMPPKGERQKDWRQKKKNEVKSPKNQIRDLQRLLNKKVTLNIGSAARSCGWSFFVSRRACPCRTLTRRHDRDF